MTEPDKAPRRRLIYGRRHGHRLRGRQAELMAALLPRLKVSAVARGTLQPADLFAQAPDDIQLEIGFGGGERLLARANAVPGTGFIGAEPFTNGVAKLLAGIDQAGLENIRIHDDDARDLLEWLAPGSIGRVEVLYPDPWPKSRHRKRRFLRAETLTELARIMKPGAELLFASDIADYVNWTLALLKVSKSFEWTAECADDWRLPPPGWTSTRYEKKAIAAGRVPTYLTFRRNLVPAADCDLVV